ncbi:MAG: glycoside hydrolase family 3 C-terminal domain-containing protein [Lachnospiraceae bacterium]|nr:glycoside hydrolase family 3 C-terminal domain-containing protein [Lachnospiraceae bacterium]MCH4103106.1 glycoside hydrolase family 3 C-terminal domain-containing protein [Lachnospiraceae bacterium]
MPRRTARRDLRPASISRCRDGKRVPGTDIQSDETDEFNEILTWVKPGCRSLVEELRERFPEAEVTYAHGYEIAGGCTDGFEEALANARDADVILLTLGGKHGSCSVASMGEGVDASDINLPVCQDLFIKEAAKLGKPMVGIHFNGRPISSDVADEYLDAILEAWNPSECGAEAIVDILTGKVNPSGKMPVTTARCAGQIPIFYNHFGGSSWDQGDSIGFKNYVDLTHLPRYYFGQGLSYTTFAYSGLSVRAEKKPAEEPAVVLPSERVLISVNVKNTGSVSGTEIAQLYLRDRHATVARPVMEMQGFARVALKPGEEKRVTFAVSPSQMAFLDEDMKWKIEKGEIEVMVGSSSADIREKGAFTISEDAWIRGRDREFWAETKVQ